MHRTATYPLNNRGLSFCLHFHQVPDILSSVTDAIQALYPFLKYSKDLLMDVLKKVT